MLMTSRTPIGAVVQLSKSYDIAQPVDYDITLDKHLNIAEPNTVVPNYSDLDYKIEYAVLGNNGYSIPTSPSTPVDADLPIILPPHRNNRSQVLFNMMPLVLVPIADDLTGAERAMYGLRTEEIINGAVYIGYHAIKITKPAIVNTTWNDVYTGASANPGISTTTMAPARVPHEWGEVIQRHRIQTSIVLSLNISPTVLARLQSACNVRYGSVHHAVINEIGICAGRYDTTLDTHHHLTLCNSVNTTAILGRDNTVAGTVKLELGSADNYTVGI